MGATDHPGIRTLESFSGMLLVASPDLRDPNFSRTVILIIEHSVEGAFGIVLNRQLPVALDDVAEAIGMEWGGVEPAPSAWGGGPVMPESIWIVQEGDAPAGMHKEVAGGIYFTSEAATIKSSIASPSEIFRVYLGYAGWGENQLDGEVAAGAWLPVDLDRNVLFSAEPEHVWLRAMAKLGIDPDRYVHGRGVH